MSPAAGSRSTTVEYPAKTKQLSRANAIGAETLGNNVGKRGLLGVAMLETSARPPRLTTRNGAAS
eukprot:10560795-Lingulodinium_polyedra.AAC.1